MSALISLYFFSPLSSLFFRRITLPSDFLFFFRIFLPFSTKKLAVGFFSSVKLIPEYLPDRIFSLLFIPPLFLWVNFPRPLRGKSENVLWQSEEQVIGPFFFSDCIDFPLQVRFWTSLPNIR